MIYEVWLDGKLLYYPNDETYSIINGVVDMALNEAGTFECDVPSSNPCYESFSLRKSMIQVLKDNVEIFYGEVREVKQNFDFTKHVYAVGELAFLFDSIQPQAKYQTTPTNMFSALLANHNSQVEARKRFILGNVLVSDPNNYIYHYTNREDTLTAIREKMCDTLDGYLKIRKENGNRYLDLVPLENYGSYCTQEISFGENLLDYSANYTSEDVATCVIPLGKRLEENERTSAAIDGLDEYLTIKGTSVDSYHTNTNNDYVFIQSAVNTFGWVRVVKTWDDITDKETLKQRAEQWLTSAQYSKLELELNAVDLNMLDHNIDTFEVGDTIHAWAEPYNMDTTFPVRKKTTYLNDLSKNYIVLSNTETSKSYTKQSSNAVSAIKDEIPQKFTILEESRKQALTLLLDETQSGHVVYEYNYDSSGNPIDIEAINLCNNKTIASSTSRWRWSSGGFGYMWRNSAATMTETSPPWQGPAVAMTSDGKINASRIITGTLDASQITVNNLSANSINTGTLNGNNVSVKNLNAGEINSGTLNANNGQFKLEMSTGEVTMKNGHFTGEVTAQKGTFGTSKSGQWELTADGFHSKNGPTASYGQTTAGTYIGKDGFCCNGTNVHTWISDGAITSNGNIYGKYLTAATSLYINGNVCVNSGGNAYYGATGIISWTDSLGNGHALNIQNGIVVYAS